MELPEVRKEVYNSTTVDVYPLVWKNYMKKGFATLFSEDYPDYNVFHLRYLAVTCTTGVRIQTTFSTTCLQLVTLVLTASWLFVESSESLC